MPTSFNAAGLFLINTLFDLYIMVWVVRVLLIWAHADYFNPFSQVVIKLTQPIVVLLRRILPKVGNLELSSLFVIILLEGIKFFLDGILTIGMPHPLGLLILALGDTLKFFCNVFFYGIILQAILSFIQPGVSPLTYVLAQITAPVLKPFRRIIPPIGGVDITPIPALILLQVIIIALVDPLIAVGMTMAFS